jgi:hypothetical protein
MSKVIYTDTDHINIDMNRLIEGNNTTERIAARMLKIMVPILKEILESRDLACISGLVRGLSMIGSSLVVSLPERMREGVAEAMKRELERGLDIAVKGPPK